MLDNFKERMRKRAGSMLSECYSSDTKIVFDKDWFIAIVLCIKYKILESITQLVNSSRGIVTISLNPIYTKLADMGYFTFHVNTAADYENVITKIEKTIADGEEYTPGEFYLKLKQVQNSFDDMLNVYNGKPELPIAFSPIYISSNVLHFFTVTKVLTFTIELNFSEIMYDFSHNARHYYLRFFDETEYTFMANMNKSLQPIGDNRWRDMMELNTHNTPTIDGLVIERQSGGYLDTFEFSYLGGGTAYREEVADPTSYLRVTHPYYNGKRIGDIHIVQSKL